MPEGRTSATVRVMGWTLAGKLIGILRDTLIGAFFGASGVGDAYAAASAVPLAINSLTGQALSTVSVPFFHEHPDEADELRAALTRVALWWLVPLALLLGALAPLYLPLVFPGLQRHISVLDAASTLSWLFALSIPFFGVASVWTGSLNARSLFTPLAAVNLVRSGTGLLLLILTRSFGVLAAGIAYLGGSLMQVIYLFPPSGRMRRPGPKVQERARAAVRLMPGQLTASVVGQVNFLVDRTFASLLSSGGLLELYFGSRFLELPVSLFGQSLATVLFPDFSRHAQDSDAPGLMRSLDRALFLTWGATVPSAALLVGLSRPATALVFGYGKFTQAAVLATSAIVAAYAGSLVFRTMQQFVARVFYSVKNTHTLAQISIGAMVLNAVLDWILVRVMGGAGIALGTTIVSALYFLLSLWLLERLVLGRRGISLRPYVGVLVASIPIIPLGFFASHLVMRHGRLADLAVMLIASPILGGLYLLLMRPLAGERGRDLMALLQRVFRAALRRSGARIGRQ